MTATFTDHRTTATPTLTDRAIALATAKCKRLVRQFDALPQTDPARPVLDKEIDAMDFRLNTLLDRLFRQHTYRPRD